MTKVSEIIWAQSSSSFIPVPLPPVSVGQSVHRGPRGCRAGLHHEGPSPSLWGETPTPSHTRHRPGTRGHRDGARSTPLHPENIAFASAHPMQPFWNPSHPSAAQPCPLGNRVPARAATGAPAGLCGLLGLPPEPLATTQSLEPLRPL